MLPPSFSRFIDHVEVRRLIRGCLVAGVVFTLYMSAGLILRYELHMPELPAAMTAFLVVAPISYFGHALFTFRVGHFEAGYALRFLGSIVLTAAISWAVMSIGVAYWALPFWMGLFVITILVPILNYLLMRLFVFGCALQRSHEPGI